MLTVVGAPMLLLNSAVPVGTVAGFQLLPFVHSLPGPVQVASCAVTSVGMAKQTLPANAMNIHVEPRVDTNDPNCLDCIPLPPQAIRNNPVSPSSQRRTPQKNIPRKNVAGNHLLAAALAARAFDAARDDGNLRRR